VSPRLERLPFPHPPQAMANYITATKRSREDVRATMSEFLDYLKPNYKYAYVATGEFKPGKFAEARELYEEAIATYSEGFEGAYLLQEPGSDRGIAVIFWDRIEDMEANKSEANEKILHKMLPLFVQPPVTTFYEVCSEIKPK